MLLNSEFSDFECLKLLISSVMLSTALQGCPSVLVFNHEQLAFL